LCGTREKKVEELRKKMMNRNLGSGHHGCCELDNRGRRSKKCGGREKKLKKERERTKKKKVSSLRASMSIH
jgi:hypothetical protein